VDFVRVSRRFSKAAVWTALLAIGFGLSVLLLPLVGAFPFDFERLFARHDPDWSIFVRLRLSRTLLALFSGGALALSGALFQAMLRDSLATPYTLGISAGASLGAVVSIWAGWSSLLGVPAVWVAALAGATLVLFIVVGAAARDGTLSSFALLLSGTALNSMCSALILVVYGFVNASQSLSISHWLIGGIDAIDYRTLTAFAFVTLVCSAIVIRQARDWNLIAVDPAWAATRGVSVMRVMLSGYGAGSVLTAVTVALAGPIGFLGLMVPHLVRERIGADHRVLLPCSFLGGAVLLAGCDAIGRAVLSPAEVSAGALMALIGGPYLVWALRKRMAGR
jgi:iron complex transport system permease protein